LAPNTLDFSAFIFAFRLVLEFSGIFIFAFSSGAPEDGPVLVCLFPPTRFLRHFEPFALEAPVSPAPEVWKSCFPLASALVLPRVKLGAQRMALQLDEASGKSDEPLHYVGGARKTPGSRQNSGRQFPVMLTQI